MKISEAQNKKTGSRQKTTPAQKRWRLYAILWPSLCILFTVIILCDSSRNMDERIGGAAFTIIPLLFFGLGMSMRHRLLKERSHATVLTEAVVISDGLRVQPGKRNYFPVFAFQAGETVYQVKYAAGYSIRIVSEGDKVDLYYNPEDPNLFFVPAVQKHDARLSMLLCAVGVIWPLLGLFAPLIQSSLL